MDCFAIEEGIVGWSITCKGVTKKDFTAFEKMMRILDVPRNKLVERDHREERNKLFRQNLKEQKESPFRKMWRTLKYILKKKPIVEHFYLGEEEHASSTYFPQRQILALTWQSEYLDGEELASILFSNFCEHNEEDENSRSS